MDRHTALMWSVAELTDALRQWMAQRPYVEPPTWGSALAYELAALVARHAAQEHLTEASAHELLDYLSEQMHDQVRHLGLGEHP